MSGARHARGRTRRIGALTLTAVGIIALGACSTTERPRDTDTARDLSSGGSGSAPGIAPNPVLPGCSNDGLSGVPLDVTNTPGWRTVFADGFDDCDLGSSWGEPYSGHPGRNTHSTWTNSMVTVSNGALHLGSRRQGGSWVTGGVSNWPVTQSYGRWDVRVRADPSDDISYHLLLWPQSEDWPPEIDFAESFDPTRTVMDGWLHWKELGGNAKAKQIVSGDFTDWHTFSVEWLPGEIRYLLDDEVWAATTEHVPSGPMWLALQAEGGLCDRRAEWGNPCQVPVPDVDTVNVDIDWVKVSAPVMDELAQMDRTGTFPPLVRQ